MAYKPATRDAVALFDHLVRCETRLYNAVNDRMRAEYGLAASQYEMLRYIGDHPGARVVDMAENFAAGVGAVSKGVDRLVARGLLRRHPNPADGRSSLVSLTAAGEQIVEDADETFSGLLAELIPLPPEQQRAVVAALAEVRSSLEASRTGVPVG